MRNKQGLSTEQIRKAELAWGYLMDTPIEALKIDIDLNSIAFDTNEAHITNSKTVFKEETLTIKLGADAYPGDNTCANSRMSLLACLSHEFSHLQRYLLGFNRPFIDPDKHLDEAETSIHASFTTVLSDGERKDLIEDAELRLKTWKEIL